MKKIVVILVTVMLTLGMFSACAKNEKEAVHVVTPDGPPALSIASLMAETSELAGKDVKYKKVSGGEAIQAAVLNGEADIAVLPMNAAAALYHKKNAKIQMLSMNVYGNLHLLSKETPSENFSLHNLKGKTVYNIGQNAIPDLMFRYLLNEAKIKFTVMTDDQQPSAEEVGLRYVTDGSDLISKFKLPENGAQFGIMGEPAVTKAKQVAGVKEAASLQTLWKETSGSETDFPQACMVVQKEFADANPAFVSAWLEKVSVNTEWVLANLDKTTEVMKTEGAASFTTYTAELVGRCNLRFQTAVDARAAFEQCMTKLVGAASLPDDGFYYAA